MRPTFMGFEAARRGLAVNQKSLDIVGHNLSNVYTQGYTRQRVDTYSVATNTKMGRFSTSKTDTAGQGVTMGGVSQTRDPFLDKRFRDEYADVGYYDQASSILADIESAIGAPESDTQTGITKAMEEINKAMSEFVNNADSKVHANVVATGFKNLALTLHQLDAKMNNIAEQQRGDLETATKNVNEILSKLSAINKTISDDINSRATDSEYYGPNELMDERNLLLDELSQYGNIDVKNNKDGTVTVAMDNRKILDGTKIETLNYRENNDGTVSIKWNSDGKPLTCPSGALKGSLDMINGRGIYAQEINDSNAKGIPYFKDKLNMYANTLASAVNKIVPTLDENGEPNGGYKQLLGARTVDENGKVSVLANAPVTAANISISDEWSLDSSYLIYKKGNTSTEIPLALANAIKSDKQKFSLNGVTTESNFKDFVMDYANEAGAEVSFNQGRYDATASISRETLDQRDGVSAVAPDEETTNMMLYNKSYQAISRLMTSLDEALDVLINKMGLVGR